MAHLFTTSMDTLFTDAYTNNLWNVTKYLCILQMDLCIQKYFASVKIPQLLPQHHSIGSDGWNTDCAGAKKEFICPPSTKPPPTRLYIFFYIALRQEALLWPSPCILCIFYFPSILQAVKRREAFSYGNHSIPSNVIVYIFITIFNIPSLRSTTRCGPSVASQVGA